MIRVGFGREKITPTMEVYISGGGNPKRLSTGILDDLFITCIAITITVVVVFIIISI